MRESRPYGQDALFFVPAIDAGTVDYDTSATLAAGDVKLFSHGGESAQVNANLSAELVAFTSGSAEPAAGAPIEGATSAALATVMFAVVTSGSWSGGDAAGFLFVKGVTGTFQAENVDITEGTANAMTIGGDTTAGLCGALASGDVVFALTADEMQCQLGHVTLIDAAGDDWDDNKVYFDTYGHPLSQHPNLGEPLGVYGQVDDASATTTVFVGAAGLSTTDDYYNGAQVVMLEGVLAGLVRPVVDYDGSGLEFTVSPAWPSAPADNARFLIVGRG